MTDNRTTELRRLLAERKVEYRETMSGNPAWMDSNGEEVVVLRSEAGLVQIRAWMTPEQAVAATLGSEPFGRKFASMRTFDNIETALSIADKEVEIEELKQLVRDMYADLKTWRFVFVITANTERIAEVERFDERMKELGIEVES